MPKQCPLLLAVVLVALVGAAHSFCIPIRLSLHANRIHVQSTLTQSLLCHGARPFTGAHAVAAAGLTTGASSFVQPGPGRRPSLLLRSSSRMSTVAPRAAVDASRVPVAGAGLGGYTESRHRAILPGEDPLAAKFRRLPGPSSSASVRLGRLFSSFHSGWYKYVDSGVKKNAPGSPTWGES